MTSTFRHARPPVYWTYLYSTAWLGFIVIAVSLYQVMSRQMNYQWLGLTALTIVVANCTIRIPGINSKISLSDIFVLLILILFGPAAGCISAALEALSGSLRCATKTRRLEFLMFNTGCVGLCAYISGLIYSAVHGTTLMRLAGSLPAALVLALSYHLLNSVTVAIMLALESRQSVYTIWKENFLWLSVNYLMCGFAAVLLACNGNAMTPTII